jgi:hypothetical protein
MGPITKIVNRKIVSLSHLTRLEVLTKNYSITATRLRLIFQFL